MSKQLPITNHFLIFLSISVSAQNYNMGNSAFRPIAGNFFDSGGNGQQYSDKRKFCDDHLFRVHPDNVCVSPFLNLTLRRIWFHADL